MSQHDLTIDNQGFPAFRADLNNALQALGSTQSGTSAPSPTFANQLWYDTTNNQLKIRNEDNDAWIVLATLDQTGDVTSGVGAKTLPAGDIVGTSDSQTLTNKTINASQLVNASVTPEKLSSAAQYTGYKNRIINGAMVIDQRNAGASVTNATTDTFAVDRFRMIGSQASKFTGQRSTTVPTGFVNSLIITSSSAYTVGASERFVVGQYIEGLNCYDLGWGTADAKTVTLSFWVRSSLTGTFTVVFRNGAGDRSYVATYTISSANTWEQKSVTVAGDTTGTWAKDNDVGINVSFNLGSGSSLNTTAGTWTAGSYFGTSAQVNVVGTNAATFYITGVQLEVGSTATSFDYRPYGTELALCQRYYQRNFNPNLGGIGVASTAVMVPRFVVQMRAIPTLSTITTPNIDLFGVGSANASTTTLDSVTATGFRAYMGGMSGSTFGQPCHLINDAFQASAEL